MTEVSLLLVLGKETLAIISVEGHELGTFQAATEGTHV